MKFCAFLRGVNVKGTSMKMAEVVDVFKKAGMEEVLSVLVREIFCSVPIKKRMNSRKLWRK